MALGIDILTTFSIEIFKYDYSSLVTENEIDLSVTFNLRTI